MEKNCRGCEWYDHQRPPGALARKPYCAALAFFLMGNHAPDCRMYRARPGVTTKRLGD